MYFHRSRRRRTSYLLCPVRLRLLRLFYRRGCSLALGVYDDDRQADGYSVALGVVDLHDPSCHRRRDRSGGLSRSDLEEVCILLNIVSLLDHEDGDRTLGDALAHLRHLNIECRHDYLGYNVSELVVWGLGEEHLMKDLPYGGVREDVTAELLDAQAIRDRHTCEKDQLRSRIPKDMTP